LNFSDIGVGCLSLFSTSLITTDLKTYVMTLISCSNWSAGWLGHLHVKSDVYGFGVVMVEMLTGLRAIDMKRPSGKQILVDWAKPYLTNRRKLKKIMDSRLEGKYSPKEASQIAHLAIKCLKQEPRFRPSMPEIAETLEQIGAIHMRLG
jgi:hypothetical protein